MIPKYHHMVRYHFRFRIGLPMEKRIFLWIRLLLVAVTIVMIMIVNILAHPVDYRSSDVIVGICLVIVVDIRQQNLYNAKVLLIMFFIAILALIVDQPIRNRRN